MNRASFIPYNHNINHLLDYLVVRPIKSGERTEWDRLMTLDDDLESVFRYIVENR